MSKVRVLYDFNAEDSNELSTYTGEELTVINPSVFDGWMEVKNSRGQKGIVPTTYVEYITSNNFSDDDIPPPPSNGPSTYGLPSTTPSWNMPAPSSTYVNQNSYINQYPSQQPDDLFNTDSFENNNSINNQTNNFASTDWNSFIEPVNSNTITNATNNINDNSKNSIIPSSDPFGDPTFASNNTNSFSTTTNTNTGNQQTTAHSKSNRSYDDDDSDFSDEEPNHNNNSTMNNSNSFYSNQNNTSKGNVSISSGTLTSANSGTVKKSKNSYGLEVFLVHGAVKNVLDSEKFSSIIFAWNGDQRQSVWKRQSAPYKVTITGYHADKKYHGVKKFTSYDIYTESFKTRVRRRYNHFDWLHERLVEKYPNICIPPLPSKAVTGNFEDEFINKRKAQLELWLNRMASHPVVGQSEVFVHFLQCDDTSSKWKQGKRKAEKDEYRAAQWFCTLTVPGESVDTTNGIKERVERFSKAATNLENSVENVSSVLEKISSLNSSTFKKEYNSLGKRLEEFGASLTNESLDAPNNSSLANALITCGNTYSQIGNMYGEQAKQDIGPLQDRFLLYKGIIQQMPDIVKFEKNAIQTTEELQSRPDKLEGRNPMELTPRREIISHVTFAEINLFNKDKVDDFSQYMKTFLEQQIKFYNEITECLKRAHSSFQKIPVSADSFNTNASFKR